MAINSLHRAIQLKAVSSVPTGVPATGPKGLASFPGLGTEETKKGLTKTHRGKQLPPSSFLVVADPKLVGTWHLPVKNADGSLNPRLMGAAKAALTVGYRGQHYQGPQKVKAKAKLVRLYAQLERQRETAVTTKPGKSPGPSIKNPKVYEALLKRGFSKERAARISNAMLKTGETDTAKFRSGAVRVSIKTDNNFGTKIENPDVYEALKNRGYSKERAITISNVLINKKRTKEQSDSLAESLEILYASRGLPPEKVSAKENYDHASTMLLMPPLVRAQVMRLQSQIDPIDLHEHGLEKLPHITVKYGIQPDLTAVQQVANQFGPITVTFGETSLFQRPEFDVVKVEADGRELRHLNDLIGQIPNIDDRPIYNPHLTIAYVQPGTGTKYIGKGPLYGRSVTVDTLVFSDETGNETAIKLGERTAVKQNAQPKFAFKDKAAGHLTVFKDRNGRYRWVSRSSNTFRDRDGEIISTKALKDDIARTDRTGEYGPLRFWHKPGWDLGSCDFNWLRGRTLIESGTFKNERIAQKVARNARNYQVSIGFLHPQAEPVDGVFHHIRRFERSLVPAGRAANPFTSLVVKENNIMSDSLKAAALKALLEDETLLNEVLAGADASEKTADGMGIAFKDVDLNNLTANDLLAVAIAKKEAEMEAEKARKEPEEKPEKKPSMDYSAFTKKMDGYMTEMKGYMDKMGTMYGKREKEADTVTAVQEATDSHSQRLAQLDQRIKSLTGELETAQATLKELAQDVPQGLKEGYRPTAAKDTETGDDVNVEHKEAQKAMNGQSEILSFLDFVAGGE